VTYDERYHGMYDDRFISPGSPSDLVRLGNEKLPPPRQLEERHASLYTGAAAKRAKAHKRHLEERYRILAFRREGGKGKEKTVEFRGKRYELEAVPTLLKYLDEQLKGDRRRLADQDREVFLVHYHMSRHLGGTALQTLRSRYEFHLNLQDILSNLLDEQNQLESLPARLAKWRHDALPPRVFQELFSIYRAARIVLIESLEEADKLRLPPLWHMKAGAPLGPYLWDKRIVGRFRWEGGRSISGKQVKKLMDQLAEVIDQARRVHYKSLGAILALHEEISRQWMSKFACGRSGSNVATEDGDE
jgi:hypothetical protein